jgi:hypothetical protein
MPGRHLGDPPVECSHFTKVSKDLTDVCGRAVIRALISSVVFLNDTLFFFSYFSMVQKATKIMTFGEDKIE